MSQTCLLKADLGDAPHPICLVASVYTTYDDTNWQTTYSCPPGVYPFGFEMQPLVKECATSPRDVVPTLEEASTKDHSRWSSFSGEALFDKPATGGGMERFVLR